VGQRDRSDAPDLEVRGFAPHMGIDEDPVTGSLNASLAQWLIADGHMPRQYVAAQGAALGRAGRVIVRSDDAAQIWIGGQAVTCIDGRVRI
jgi:PhzF family phenazine biosynthesis protein